MTIFCCSVSTARAIESRNQHDFVRINHVCRRYRRGSKITDDTWVEVTVISRSKLWLAMHGIKNGKM